MASPSNSSSALDDLLYWNGNEQPPSDFDEESFEPETANVDIKEGIVDKGKGTKRQSMYVRLFEGGSANCLWEISVEV